MEEQVKSEETKTSQNITPEEIIHNENGTTTYVFRMVVNGDISL